MLSFSSVAEAYRPDPPSPAGVNFFLTITSLVYLAQTMLKLLRELYLLRFSAFLVDVGNVLFGMESFIYCTTIAFL